MKIKEGDKLPPAEFYHLDTDGIVQKIDSSSLFKDQKVIMFGVPGAFTKVCSTRHLPSYVKNYDEAKKKIYLKLFVFR